MKQIEVGLIFVDDDLYDSFKEIVDSVMKEDKLTEKESIRQVVGQAVQDYIENIQRNLIKYETRASNIF